MGLFSGCSLGSCGAAEGCGETFLGLWVGQGVGEGWCVGISGVGWLCLWGWAALHRCRWDRLVVSPVRGSVPWEELRVCPCLQLRSSEKLLPIPMFCIVATAVVWAAALYFFFQTLSSWEVNFHFFFFCPSLFHHLSFLVFVLHKKDSGEESWAAHGELKWLNSFSRFVKGAWEAVLSQK